MSVVLEDYSIKVEEALEDAVISILYEIAGELETQTSRNSSTEKYKGIPARELWSHDVDESQKIARVGSQYEAAYWEEFGTGEYALHGDGRKGWWVYVEGNDTPRKNQKYYTKDEAESAAAFLRSKGLDAHATNGRKPNRPLHNAFEQNGSKLVNKAEKVLKERMGK